MGDVRKKWWVTYTKHVKQKRKVYQDGSLRLLSNNKIMLYDESEQLLDSRFLTEDEVVESGESLSFTSFLVDIGDPEANPDIISCANSKYEDDHRTKERTELQHGEKLATHHIKGKLKVARRKTSAINRSPSQMIIREFKKNEQFKYEVQQTRSPPSTTNSSFTEWEALYTTQITQKAKKYHDGFIRMIACGSQGRQMAFFFREGITLLPQKLTVFPGVPVSEPGQAIGSVMHVILYDSSKNQLDKRFLKKDEVVSSGESLTFDAYLVDIGDHMRNKEDDTDVKLHGKNCKITEKGDTITGQQWHKSFADAQRIKVTSQQNQFKVGKSATKEKSQQSACSSKHINSNLSSLAEEKMKLGEMHPSQMRLRDAHQILSILRNPRATERALIVREAPAKQCLSQSPELVQLDSKTWEIQGSFRNDQHSSGMVTEKCKDEKTENEGYTRIFPEGNVTQSETGHHDLSAPTGTHNNNKGRPDRTQGIQVVKSSTLVGSALIDRLRADVHHGAAVILDSGEDADFSPVKSEAGIHQDQACYESRTKLPGTCPSEAAAGPTLDRQKPSCPPPMITAAGTCPKSEAAAGPTLDRQKPSCSTTNDHGCIRLNVKIEKAIETFDGPNFDLGI